MSYSDFQKVKIEIPENDMAVEQTDQPRRRQEELKDYEWVNLILMIILLSNICIYHIACFWVFDNKVE